MSVHLNGLDQYVDFGEQPALAVGGSGFDDFYFSLWHWSEETSTDDQFIFAFRKESGDATRIFAKFVESDDGSNPNKIQFTIHDGSTESTIYSDAAWAGTNQWLHLIFYRSGLTIGMYIDNTAQADTDLAVVSLGTVTDLKLQLGRDPLNAASYCKGFYSHFAVNTDDATIDATGATNLYNGGTPPDHMTFTGTQPYGPLFFHTLGTPDTPLSVSGESTGWVNTDGVADYIEVTDSDSIVDSIGDGDFTIAINMASASLGSSDQYYVALTADSGTETDEDTFIFKLKRISQSSVYQWQINTKSGSTQNVDSAGAEGTPQHLRVAILSRESGTMYMRLNDVQEADTTADTTDFGSGASTIRWGCRGAGVDRFAAAKFGQTMIINRALTASEKTELFNDGEWFDWSTASFADEMSGLWPIKGDDSTGLTDGLPNSQVAHADGVDEYTQIDYDANLAFSTSFTVNLWYRPDTLAGASTSRTLASNLPASPNQSWHFYLKDDKPRFSIYPDGITQVFNHSAVAAVANTTSMVTGVYNSVAQTLEVYIDGQDQSGTTSGVVTTSITPNSFGITFFHALVSGGDWFDGKVWNVSFFNSALTAGNISDIYDLGPTRKPNSVVTPVEHFQHVASSGAFPETNGTVIPIGGDHVNMESGDFTPLYDGTYTSIADSAFMDPDGTTVSMVQGDISDVPPPNDPSGGVGLIPDVVTNKISKITTGLVS